MAAMRSSMAAKTSPEVVAAFASSDAPIPNASGAEAKEAEASPNAPLTTTTSASANTGINHTKRFIV
jgi:hypothetical protein